VAGQSFTQVAVRLVRIIGESECAVAGGLAVNAHGYVRATKDIDIVVSLPLAEARRRLAARGVKTTLFRGDVLEGDFSCLKGALSGVPFDVIPPLVPIEPERAVRIELHRQVLPIVDFETLTRLKLKAGSPKDLLDIAMLAIIRPQRRERVLQLAAYDPDMRARLLSFLDDPRLKRDARERALEVKLQESQGQDRGTRKPPPKARAKSGRARG